MSSEFEQEFVRSLRELLAPLQDGESIADSEFARQMFSCAEHFMGLVIREIHPNGICLDGLMPLVRKRIDAGELLLVGTAYTLYSPRNYDTSTGVVPFHLRLQFAPDCEEVTWLECRLGERADKGIKHDSSLPAKKLVALADSAHSPDEIDWYYKVTFGERRSSRDGG